MKIVGHRGAAGLAPENTAQAIKAGLKFPIDAIEFDLHATKDGVLVLHHDGRGNRTLDLPRPISELKFSQLLKLTGKNTPLLRLEDAVGEIIKRSQTAEIIIDCKSNGWDVPLAKFFAKHSRNPQLLSRIIVLSFWVRPLAKFKKQFPNGRCYYLYKRVPFLHIPISKVYGFEGVGFNYQWVFAPIIWISHWLGLKTYYYTVNDLKYARRYQRLHLTYLATDRPDIINHKSLTD